ncbi:MAG: hypothetical protein IJX17_03125 [Clostridia bacterium]|nr:hypothetical protein [Clostridia bacterium]
MEKTFPSIYIKSIKIQKFNKIDNFECKTKKQIVILREKENTFYLKDLIDAVKWCFCLKSTGECFETVLKQEKTSVKITAKCGSGDVTFYKELCRGKEKYIVSRTRQDFKNYRRICEALYDQVASDLFFISEDDKYKNIKKLISECAVKSIDNKSIITDSPREEINGELELQSNIIKTKDDSKLIFDKKFDAHFVKDNRIVNLTKYNENDEKLRAYYTKLVWNKVITKLSKINIEDATYSINRPPIFFDNIHSQIDEEQCKIIYENIYNLFIDTINPYQVFIIDKNEVSSEVLSKKTNNIIIIDFNN